MKVVTVEAEVKGAEVLVVACDVGSEWVDSYGKFSRDGRTYEVRDHVRRRTRDIETMLKNAQHVATEAGFAGVHVVCEPTGGYERMLLGSARRLGCQTGYVSGQAVNRLQIMEGNDTGKTDRKDPKVIQSLAIMGKTLSVRVLPGEYAVLRTLGEAYESLDRQLVELRTRLHSRLLYLFPDWPMQPPFLHTRTGAALLENYAGSPGRIAGLSLDRFVVAMRKVSGKVRRQTLECIHAAALISTRHVLERGQVEVLEGEIRALHEDIQRLEARKADLRQRMEELYRKLPESPKLSAIPRVSDFLMARLIAETGPLADFGHCRQLVRYAGLNLCERTSGKYVGQVKTSRKGRAGVRKVLYQIVMSTLIMGNGLYKTYYRNNVGNKSARMPSVVAVMRHFLRCVYGTYRSERAFDLGRVFCSESRQQKLA